MLPRRFYRYVYPVPLAEKRIVTLFMTCDLVTNKRFREHPLHNKQSYSLKLFSHREKFSKYGHEKFAVMFTRGCHWFVLPERPIFICP